VVRQQIVLLALDEVPSLAVEAGDVPLFVENRLAGVLSF
jgi:hypothetical protein